MASVLEIVRGIAQAAANAYDGALDEDGSPVKTGLKREEEVPITDKRVMDGFAITFHGDKLKLNYQCDLKLKEVHNSDFENGINDTINQVASFLKREYKKLTGDTLSLTSLDEADIMVQSISNIRSFVQASRQYKVGGLKDVEAVSEPSEDRLNDSVKKFLELGKKAKKPSNVTRKNA
tara:strand:- start:30 stop:563 length:534 start_codon:yes stop_codon:yes gene_type:complete